MLERKFSAGDHILSYLAGELEESVEGQLKLVNLAHHAGNTTIASRNSFFLLVGGL